MNEFSGQAPLSIGTRHEHRPTAARSRLALRYDLLAIAGLTFLLTTITSRAATAQSSNTEESSDAGTSVKSLEEIVVTANKRAEPLMTAPSPVTAISGAQLNRLQAVKFSDYVATVPGLNLISDREGETQIVLRGITTGSPVNSTVAVYVDGAPYGSSTSDALGGWLQPDLDPSDLQRVEVLRGPQGTLYGASALGGLIKYVTLDPDLKAFDGRIELDGNSVRDGADGYGARGMLNIPLVADTLGFRVSAYDRRDPGYISDSQLHTSNINGTRVDGGHATLYWKPTESLSIKLFTIAQNIIGQGTSDEDVHVTGNSIVPIYGDLKQVRYASEPLDVRYRLYSGTINYDMQWATLESISSYSTQQQSQIFDETATFGALGTLLTGLPNFGTSTGSGLHLDKWTQEVRLSSPGGSRLEWLGGFFFTHEDSGRNEPTYAFDTLTGSQLLPVNTLFFAYLDSHYTEYAGYGDITYHFTPAFDVTAGVRYSTNHQTFLSDEDGIFAGGPSTVSGTSSDHSVTYLVTPKYQFDSHHMLYARVATGYRPGGPNAPTPSEVAAGVPNAYRPDTLTDYDLGYKASVLSNRMTVDLSVFHIDWQHIQILTDYNGITTEGNGGTAASDGFEAAATITPVHGLTVSGNLAYTKARLTEDAPGVNGRNGDELPNVPKWAGYLDASYSFPLAVDATGFVGGGFHYVGDRESGFVTGSPPNFSRPVMGSYTSVDLRSGIDYRRWTFELYVKNLGNTLGIENLTSMNLSGYTDPWTASVTQPRTIGLSVSARF